MIEDIETLMNNSTGNLKTLNKLFTNQDLIAENLPWENKGVKSSLVENRIKYIKYVSKETIYLPNLRKSILKTLF